jgi:hypothetical protein
MLIYEMFQSLSGFLARCDSHPCMGRHRQKHCFNPCRVFSLVATMNGIDYQVPYIGFQSLSGFLARCDIMAAQDVNAKYGVSIPVGFSRSLRQ